MCSLTLECRFRFSLFIYDGSLVQVRMICFSVDWDQGKRRALLASPGEPHAALTSLLSLVVVVVVVRKFTHKRCKSEHIRSLLVKEGWDGDEKRQKKVQRIHKTETMRGEERRAQSERRDRERAIAEKLTQAAPGCSFCGLSFFLLFHFSRDH